MLYATRKGNKWLYVGMDGSAQWRSDTGVVSTNENVPRRSLKIFNDLGRNGYALYR